MVWVCVFGSMDLVRVNRWWRWVCSSVGFFFFFFFKMGLVIGGSGLMVLVLVLVVLMVVWV